jgi:hypothetical protein
MQLTKKQHEKLLLTRTLRAQNPTALWYISQFWRSYLLLVIAAAIFVPYLWWTGLPLASMFVAGMVFATLLNACESCRNFVKGWPLSKAITDWGQIDELLANNLRPAP